jgi:transposase
MIPWRGEDLRDGVSSEVTDGFFSRRAAAAKNANQSRRLFALAAVLDGMNRTDAARVGGMDHQTLRDWVHRFNELRPTGFSTIGRRAPRHASRPSSKRN